MWCVKATPSMTQLQGKSDSEHDDHDEEELMQCVRPQTRDSVQSPLIPVAAPLCRWSWCPPRFLRSNRGEHTVRRHMEKPPRVCIRVLKSVLPQCSVKSSRKARWPYRPVRSAREKKHFGFSFTVCIKTFCYTSCVSTFIWYCRRQETSFIWGARLPRLQKNRHKARCCICCCKLEGLCCKGHWHVSFHLLASILDGSNRNTDWGGVEKNKMNCKILGF